MFHITHVKDLRNVGSVKNMNVKMICQYMWHIFCEINETHLEFIFNVESLLCSQCEFFMKNMWKIMFGKYFCQEK